MRLCTHPLYCLPFLCVANTLNLQNLYHEASAQVHSELVQSPSNVNCHGHYILEGVWFVIPVKLLTLPLPFLLMDSETPEIRPHCRLLTKYSTMTFEGLLFNPYLS